MSRAYYNEIDSYAAAWLRNLIAGGHIAPGDVDERDIRDVRPDDLRGYTQCHFFAGIGVWSHALRRAGWPDDRPVWTGSCPCQPFSAAGGGAGFTDERHLWPHWHHLIRVVRPPHVFGEQVASKDGLGWLDLVSADMEGEGYAFWPTDLCAAGVGAPHIRQRLWFVGVGLADADHEQQHGGRDAGSRRRYEHPDGGTACGLDHHHHHQGSQRHTGNGDRGGRWSGETRSASEASVFGRLPDTESSGRGEERPHGGGGGPGNRAEGWPAGHSSSSSSTVRLVDADQPDKGNGELQRCRQLGGLGCDEGAGTASGRPGPTNGLWADADWLLCRDGKWRPVEPGTFPLAHGAPARVGRLRAYGNAINAEAAEAIVATYLEHEAAALACGGSLTDEFDVLLEAA